jgi:hypothetical protein
MHQQRLYQVIVDQRGVNNRQRRQHLCTVHTRRGIRPQRSTAAATAAAGGWLAGRPALLLLLLLWRTPAAAAVCCCHASDVSILFVLFPSAVTFRFVEVWQGAALGLLLARIPVCVCWEG